MIMKKNNNDNDNNHDVSKEHEKFERSTPGYQALSAVVAF